MTLSISTFKDSLHFLNWYIEPAALGCSHGLCGEFILLLPDLLLDCVVVMFGVGASILSRHYSFTIVNLAYDICLWDTFCAVKLFVDAD